MALREQADIWLERPLGKRHNGYKERLYGLGLG